MLPRRPKKQKAEDPGWEDSSISSRTESIHPETLGEYIEHLSRSFRIPASVMTQFNQTVKGLAEECYRGQRGLSTSLSGTLDDETSFYTVVYIMQDNTGFTVAHSHHTVTTERGQPFSHDAKYLESSALKDLERLGVKGARDLYQGNQVLDQPEYSSRGAAYSHSTEDPHNSRHPPSRKATARADQQGALAHQAPETLDIPHGREGAGSNQTGDPHNSRHASSRKATTRADQQGAFVHQPHEKPDYHQGHSISRQEGANGNQAQIIMRTYPANRDDTWMPSN